MLAVRSHVEYTHVQAALIEKCHEHASKEIEALQGKGIGPFVFVLGAWAFATYPYIKVYPELGLDFTKKLVPGAQIGLAKPNVFELQCGIHEDPPPWYSKSICLQDDFDSFEGGKVPNPYSGNRYLIRKTIATAAAIWAVKPEESGKPVVTWMFHDQIDDKNTPFVISSGVDYSIGDPTPKKTVIQSPDEDRDRKAQVEVEASFDAMQDDAMMQHPKARKLAWS